jgi:hypothetical protein
MEIGITIYKWMVVAVLLLSAFAITQSVGREREPLTEEQAVASLILVGFFVLAVLL